MHKLYSNKWVIFSLVLPGLLTFIIAILSPIILSLFYSMTNYSGLGEATYIGLQNYLELLKDKVFWRTWSPPPDNRRYTGTCRHPAPHRDLCGAEA